MMYEINKKKKKRRREIRIEIGCAGDPYVLLGDGLDSQPIKVNAKTPVEINGL